VNESIALLLLVVWTLSLSFFATTNDHFFHVPATSLSHSVELPCHFKKEMIKTIDCRHSDCIIIKNGLIENDNLNRILTMGRLLDQLVLPNDELATLLLREAESANCNISTESDTIPAATLLELASIL
jgi:hypothetical protein